MISRTGITYGVVDPDAATVDTGLAFLRGMIAHRHPSPPFAGTTDIWLIEADEGRVVFEATPAQSFLNPLGTIHGGWISTVLDSAMGCAVHSTLKPGFGYTTVDMAITFTRAVLPTTGRLRCEGKVIHIGGRIASAEGRLTDATGKLLAHGTETCLILRVGDARAA